jgi:membrane protein
LTVVSAFPVFKSLIGHLQSFVMQNMLPQSVGAVTTYTERFFENAARLTAVGIVFLGVTALLLMLTIDSAFNHIWRVSRPLLQRVLV